MDGSGRRVPQRWAIVASLALLLSLTGLTAAASEFNSTNDPNVYPMFEGFSSMGANTLAENNQMVIAITRAATTAEKIEAARTADFPFQSTRISIPEALGSKLGPMVVAAENQGRLPRTVALLAQHADNSNYGLLDLYETWHSASTLKDVFKNPRPYCALPSLTRGPTTTPTGHQIYISDCSHPNGNYSFPSGHSRSAYIEGITLATFLPELAPQILARTAQVANNRVVLGVHYPLDIIAGQALAERMVAYRYHDPAWRARLLAAREELRSVLMHDCGGTIAACVASEQPYLPTQDALALSRGYLTYRCASASCIAPTAGFTQTGQSGIPLTPPTYAYELLATAHPDMSPTQRDRLLSTTAIDSGYPLDTTGTNVGPASAGWTRIDLASAMAYQAPKPPVRSPSPSSVPATPHITAVPTKKPTAVKTIAPTAKHDGAVGTVMRSPITSAVAAVLALGALLNLRRRPRWG